MAVIKLSEDKINFIKDVCKSFRNDGGEVINVLHKVQGEYATSQQKFRNSSLRS